MSNARPEAVDRLDGLAEAFDRATTGHLQRLGVPAGASLPRGRRRGRFGRPLAGGPGRAGRPGAGHRPRPLPVPARRDPAAGGPSARPRRGTRPGGRRGTSCTSAWSSSTSASARTSSPASWRRWRQEAGSWWRTSTWALPARPTGGRPATSSCRRSPPRSARSWWPEAPSTTSRTCARRLLPGARAHRHRLERATSPSTPAARAGRGPCRPTPVRRASSCRTAASRRSTSTATWSSSRSLIASSPAPSSSRPGDASPAS